MLFKWNSRTFLKNFAFNKKFRFPLRTKKNEINFINDFLKNCVCVYVCFICFYVIYTYVRKYDMSNFIGFIEEASWNFIEK